MDEIELLGLDDVLFIHQNQIERYGGTLGIRDIGLLKSAVAMPQAGFGNERLHRDVFEMAAAYLFHITRNHPFLDGNKRTGLVAALVFLSLNGCELDADESETEQLVRGIAEGRLDKAAASEFFKSRSAG